MHRKWVTCELHDSYFRSMTIKQTIPKTAEVTHSDGQLGEEITGAQRRVHISAWEVDGNKGRRIERKIVKNFRCSRKLFPSLLCVRYLGHRLLTSKSPSLIDERF